VASEALSLVDGARRIESAASKLERAAGRRMCIGVFGPSQSGKSYLVSSLCKPPPGSAGGKETVIAEFDGQELDFLKEINPPGDKESTGLVTRLHPAPGSPPASPPPCSSCRNESSVLAIGLCDFDANRLEFDPPVPAPTRSATC
jgi:hypothetical protein